MRARLACLLALAGLAFVDARASAQDPLRLNQDPTSFTDVIDAFDEGDSFDLNVHAGFRREQRNAVLRRETLDPMRGVGRTVELGDVEHVRNLLDLGLDIGVFRDVMLYGRLPIVLSDDRRILAASPTAGDALIAPFPTYDSPTFGAVPGGSPPLFRMPFESPTRSGIDVLQVGLAFDLTNQARRPALPTWMMLFELELGIGKVAAVPRDAGRHHAHALPIEVLLERDLVVELERSDDHALHAAHREVEQHGLLEPRMHDPVALAVRGRLRDAQRPFVEARDRLLDGGAIRRLLQLLSVLEGLDDSVAQLAHGRVVVRTARSIQGSTTRRHARRATSRSGVV